MIARPRSTKRFATGVLILALASPLAAQRQAPVQRGGAPKPETPQLIVSVLASSDPAVGLALSDAIRRRIQDQHHATELYVVPDQKVDQALVGSGYNPDSVLGTADLMLLAKNLRGDYALAGTVERTASGVRTSIRLLTEKGQQLVAEPLPEIVGSDFSDIAKQVDRAVSEAVRALAFHRDCMNALATGDHQRALAAAQQGLRIRPTSAALNQCVLASLRATSAAPDSIIAVASRITAVDSTNVIAWANLDDAYSRSGDTVRALDAAHRLRHLDPANINVTSALVDRLVGAGRDESALAVIDTALNAAPGTVELLRKRWLIHLRRAQYKEALVSGAALIAADTSVATVEFFERQLGAAQSLRDTVAIRRQASDASTRFPRNVNFLMILARDAFDRAAMSEAIGFAERVLAIEPATAGAWQIMIIAHAKANGTDSAVAAARRALAAGVPKDDVGGSLITLVSPSLAAAQASQKRADWEVVLRTAQAVDSVVSTARSAFYIGFSAYQIAADEVQALGEFAARRTSTAAQRQAACASVTRAEELLSVVTISMPKGGSVEPTVAGKILGALPGMTEFLTPVKQASCRARPDSEP